MDAILLDQYLKMSRPLMITHESRHMMADIRAVINGSTEGVPKYRIYSAHDTNIANWLEQWNPSYKWNGIQYAAQIRFELYQNLSGQWFIKLVYDGVELRLEKCVSTVCTEAEFFAQEKDRLYQGDLQVACAKDPFALI